MSIITDDGVRAVLTLGRIAFAAALALFIGILFFLLRRNGGGSGGS
jgi:hypothetical protein